MDLLLRVANMDEADCRPEWVEDLYLEFGIAHTLAGVERGYEEDLRTRSTGLVFSFTETNTMREQLARAGMTDDFVAPSDPRWTPKLWPILRDFRDGLRSRLDQFIAGQVDLGVLSDILNSASMSDWCFQVTDNVWKPRVSYTYSTRTIEDVIEIREILEPFFFGQGEQFSRVRKCQNCGTYFLAAYKAKAFCSNKCRSAYHYKVAH